MQMALDEAISESVAAGGPPTIRFYTWNPKAVSIGYFQSMHDEVDVPRCRVHGVDVIRRRTGGGAVYHDNELTYSVIAPTHLFPREIIASYRHICAWIIHGLHTLGIAAEFVPINDIIVSGKKISGNAQTRRKNVLLQHGTILYTVDVDTMFTLLRVPNEKVRNTLIQDVKQRVTSVSLQAHVPFQRLYEVMFETFQRTTNAENGRVTQQERTRAQELAVQRYVQDSWTYLR